MDELKLVAQIFAISGVALGVILALFREILRKSVFLRLTKQQTYNLIRLFLFVTWTIAIAGIVAWVLVGGRTNGGFDSDAFRHVIYTLAVIASIGGITAAVAILFRTYFKLRIELREIDSAQFKVQQSEEARRLLDDAERLTVELELDPQKVDLDELKEARERLGRAIEALRAVGGEIDFEIAKEGVADTGEPGREGSP